MFEQFHGFTSTPFSKSVGTSDMFMHKSLKELIKRFEYIKENRGIMVLVGDPGLGKTTALRYFMNSLNTQSFFCVYIPLSTVSINDFYRQINEKLQGDHAYFKAHVYKAIQNRIIDSALNKNIIPVIIFDEAHLLKEQNIRELQILTNFKCDTLDPAIIVLAGQDTLLGKLKKPSINSFYQRVALKYRLISLDKQEIIDYVKHSFKICNCDDDLLTPPAFDALFKLSQGKIRIIGDIVKKALTLSAILKKKIISEEEIITASEEVL